MIKIQKIIKQCLIKVKYFLFFVKKKSEVVIILFNHVVIEKLFFLKNEDICKIWEV